MHISRDRSNSNSGKISAEVGTIVVDDVLTCCVLIHFVCDSRAAQMEIQSSLNREL